jgi:tRNA-2-methylthio-N6-dimethylallyladenosine synthase
MKYHVITLGCQMNKSDGERVTAVIEQMGYRYTEHEEEAQLLGILACSVRQKAIDKVYTKIHKWNKRKQKENLITFVSGCVLPTDNEKFLKLFDLIFSMSELPQFPDMLHQYGVATPASLKRSHQTEESVTQRYSESQRSVLINKAPFGIPDTKTAQTFHPGRINRFWNIKPEYASEFEAFVPIQNGCNKFCTFCAVPYTRGREISRPSGEILAEVKSLVEQGYKSITLLGQNVNSYGFDKKGEELSFAALLEAIGKYGNSTNCVFWVYYTSPHPRDMKDEVLKTMATYNCLAKQVHLPLQSGDDKVLIRMNRKHTLSDYRTIVQKIRKWLPEATLFTDIIVGFTGETEEQLESTRMAMEEFKFNMAYIAKYSPRPGAASARWDDDIPNDVKTQRLHILTDELKKHNIGYNQALVGKTCKVLVNGHDRKPGYLSAATEGKIIVRFASTNESLIGQFAHVTITSATPFSTEGELVPTTVSKTIAS